MGGVHDASGGDPSGGGGEDGVGGPAIPLSDAARTVIVVVHYSALPAVGLAIYAVQKRIHVFERRIWSPFLLVTALTWLQMAAAFEIANHYYVNDWELYDPRSDLINGSFYFFNFGSQNLLALSLRRDLPFLRRGTRFREWIPVVADPIMIALIPVYPIVYGTAGRSTSAAALSPLAAVAGVLTLVRAWYNLGPNPRTKWGGICFFALAMTGVAMNAVYNATGAEWVHALIGGSFIASTIPLTVAFWNAEMPPPGESGQLEVPERQGSKEDNVEP